MRRKNSLIFVFFTTIALMLSAINAEARSFKRESNSWACESESSATSVSFYSTGTGSSATRLVYIINDAGAGCNVFSNNSCLGDEFYYGTQTGDVVRMVMQSGSGNFTSTNGLTGTVVLPNGKVYITPAGGSAVEMTKNGNTYTANIAFGAAASFSITGDNHTGTLSYNKSATIPSSSGLPSSNSCKLNLTGIAVTAATATVTFNLQTNQVTQVAFVTPSVTLSAPTTSWTNEIINLSAVSINVTSPVYSYSVKTPGASGFTACTSDYTPATAGTYTFNVDVAESSNSTVILASDNKAVTVTDKPMPITIRVKNDIDWEALYIHAWESGGGDLTTWTACPAMTSEGNGWFSYTFEEVTSLQFLVKNASGNVNGSTTFQSENGPTTTTSTCFILNTDKTLTKTEDCPSFVDITVKAKKPSDWDDVMYAYRWTVGESSFLPMTAIAENEGWFEYTFEDVIAPINVIFVNGGDWTGGDSKQTVDVSVPKSTCYIIGEGEEKRTATPTTCPGDDEPELTDITIKVRNDIDWEALYIHAWEHGGGEFTTWAECPAMTDIGNGWFAHTFKNVSSLDFLVKNASGDVDGSSTFQSEDSPTITVSTCFILNADKTLTETEDCPIPIVKDITIKAKRPAEWTETDLSIWMWGPENAGALTKMTAIAENAGWFEYTFEDVVAPINITFVNGADWAEPYDAEQQTADVKGIMEDKCYIINSATDGEGKRKVAVSLNCANEPELTDITIKVRNDINWEALYIHAWEHGGGEFTTWAECPAMTDIGNGWFAHTFKNVSSLDFLVKNASGDVDGSSTFQSEDSPTITVSTCFILNADKTLTETEDCPIPIVKDITIKAKRPVEWTETNLSIWMWGPENAGSIYFMDDDVKNPGWFEYTFEDVVAPINITFVNGADWAEPYDAEQQTADVKGIMEDKCYIINSATDGEGKRTVTEADCPGLTSINPFVKSNNTIIYTLENQIVVLAKGVIRIADVSNRLFAQTNSTGQFTSAPLQKGIYLVSVEGNVYKVAVK